MPTTEHSPVARVYDRVAPFYDLYEGPVDLLGGRGRRRRVLGDARGDLLEVGVGTGRNLEFYATDARLTGIDISGRMLDRARTRAARLGREVDLRWADVEDLPFDDASFDTVTATCVFCSVGDPVRGLQEVRRVVKPGGEVRLLEHVRPRNPMLGRVFDWLTPVTRALMGPEINRRTEDNVRAAGLRIETVRRNGIWREILARPAPSAA
jgi:phosphatidylethanolamine/phosphatidyl-N-methylethanolamine N-methyltransferase